MESHNKARHLNSATHHQTVAKYEETWILKGSSSIHVNTNPGPAVLEVSPSKLDESLSEDVTCSTSPDDKMDLDPPPQVQSEVLLSDESDVGFFTRTSPVSDSPELDWDDYLYSSLKFHQYKNGKCAIIGQPRLILSQSNLSWYPVRNEDVC
jgi:hypothetical protein